MNIKNEMLFLLAKAAVEARDFAVSGALWALLFHRFLKGGSGLSVSYLKGSTPYYDLALIQSGERYRLCIPIPLLTRAAIVELLRAGVETRSRDGVILEQDIELNSPPFRAHFNSLKPEFPVWVLNETPWSWGNDSERAARFKDQALQAGYEAAEMSVVDDPIEVIREVHCTDRQGEDYRRGTDEQTYKVKGAHQVFRTMSLQQSTIHDDIRRAEVSETVFGADAVLVFEDVCLPDHSQGQKLNLYLRPKADLDEVFKWVAVAAFGAVADE